MIEKYLPLGTIVLLKGATKRIMIIGFGCIDAKTKQEYDYLIMGYYLTMGAWSLEL